MPTTLVASDLDRTLIYSAAAMATLGAPVTDRVCVEVYEGRETSFMSRGSLAALGELSRRAPFVPVTTRTRQQYARIRLGDVWVTHAVTTNGARILVNGVACRDWTREVDRVLTESASYDEVVAAVAHLLDRPWVSKVRSAEDRFVYAVTEPTQVPADWYAAVETFADRLGWVVSVQGRKVYLIPRLLSKEAAVAEVARRLGTTRLVAAGDSLLDRGLLVAADVAIRPAHGELHETGWTTPGLVITATTGGRAGEEIVERLAALADAPAVSPHGLTEE